MSMKAAVTGMKAAGWSTVSFLGREAAPKLISPGNKPGFFMEKRSVDYERRIINFPNIPNVSRWCHAWACEGEATSRKRSR